MGRRKNASRRKPTLQLDEAKNDSQTPAVDPYRQTAAQSTAVFSVKKSEQEVQAPENNGCSDVAEVTSSLTEKSAIDSKLKDFLKEISDLGSNGPTEEQSTEVGEAQQSVSGDGTEAEGGQGPSNILNVGAYSSDQENMEEDKVTEKDATGQVTFWKQVVDPNTNHAYYWNPQTNEVCWTLPDNAVIADDQAEQASEVGEGSYTDLYEFYATTYYENLRKEKQKSRSADSQKSTVTTEADVKSMLAASKKPKSMASSSTGAAPTSNALTAAQQKALEDLEVRMKAGTKRKAPSESEDVVAENEDNPVSKKPRLKKTAGLASAGDGNTPKKGRATSPLSKQAEQALRFQVSNMADELSRKLHYLHVTNEGLSDVQVLSIQLQTRLSDWKEGGISSKFMLSKLNANAITLKQYEQSAAPEGWKVIWDGTSCRYQYHNLSTGESTWQYPIQFAAEAQSSELSSQEDSSDIETTTNSPLPHQPELSSAEPLTTPATTEDISDSITRAPLTTSVDESNSKSKNVTSPLTEEVKSYQPATSDAPKLSLAAEQTKAPQYHGPSTEQTTKAPQYHGPSTEQTTKAPQYHGPTAEYLMTRDDHIVPYKHYKSRSNEVQPPPPPPKCDLSVDTVRQKLYPSQRPRRPRPPPEITDAPVETTDSASKQDGDVTVHEEGMEFISEFPPRETSVVEKRISEKPKVPASAPTTSSPIEEPVQFTEGGVVEKDEVVDDEVCLRERLLERQKHRIKNVFLGAKDSASLSSIEESSESQQGVSPLPDDRVEQATGEHERSSSVKLATTEASIEALSTNCSNRGSLDDSRVEPETGEVETVASSNDAVFDSSTQYGPSLIPNEKTTEQQSSSVGVSDTVPYGPKLDSNENTSLQQESPSKQGESFDGAEDGEIVKGSPTSSSSESSSDSERDKMVSLGRCYMDIEEEKTGRKKSLDKDDRHVVKSDDSDQYSIHRPSSSRKKSRSRSSSRGESSRRSDKHNRRRYHDDHSGSDRDRYHSDDDRHTSRRRRRSSRRSRRDHSSDESDERSAKKDRRHSHHRSSHSYYHDSDDDRSRKRSSRREESSRSSRHSSRRNRSRSHSSRRRRRSHSRDSQSSYQSDYSEKRTPSSKHKKSKRDKKKKHRKSDKEKKEEVVKPPPHVIVGKVGRISSKRTLGKDKKTDGEGSETVTSESANSGLKNQSPTTSQANTTASQQAMPQAMSATFYQQPSTGQVPYYTMDAYGSYQAGSYYDPNVYQTTAQWDQTQQQWTGEGQYGVAQQAPVASAYETYGSLEPAQQTVASEAPLASESTVTAQEIPPLESTQQTATAQETPPMESTQQTVTAQETPPVALESTQQTVTAQGTPPMAMESTQQTVMSDELVQEAPVAIESDKDTLTVDSTQEKDPGDTQEQLQQGQAEETVTADVELENNELEDQIDECEMEIDENSPSAIEEPDEPVHVKEDVIQETTGLKDISESAQENDTSCTVESSTIDPVQAPPINEFTLPEEPTIPDKDQPPLPPADSNMDDTPSLPPKTNEEDAKPPEAPPEGTLSPKTDTPTTQSDTPPDNEAVKPNADSEAPKPIATIQASTTSSEAQVESNTVSTAPVSNAVASAYYQPTTTATSGAYADYTAYALAAQQQQAYNYAYGTNNYSGYMQAYNTYVQQASAAAAYQAYGGQYYPGSYGVTPYAGASSYASPYSTSAAYYGTGTQATTAGYYTGAYQTTQSQQVQPAQSIPVTTAASTSEAEDAAKKSEFTLAGSKQKLMKNMIDKWSTFKEPSKEPPSS